MPEPRTGHNIRNVEIAGAGREDGASCASTGHTLSFRYKTSSTPTSAPSRYTLDTQRPKPLIKRKNVVLKNDYIHHVLDVYHI